jgi:hypothetical protein
MIKYEEYTEGESGETRGGGKGKIVVVIPLCRHEPPSDRHKRERKSERRRARRRQALLLPRSYLCRVLFRYQLFFPSM